MARPIALKRVIHTALISAVSIATALIWKDVVINTIRTFVQPEDALIYEFLVALIATIILIAALYLYLKTESQAEFVMKKLKGGTVKFVRAPPEKKIKKD
jgi:hypothetical protein